MRQTWPALILGALLLHGSAAFAQFPLGPGSPGVPPVGQTEPGAPGVPVPPVPPEVPGVPEVPYNAPAPPSFAEPKQGNAFDGVSQGSEGPGFYFTLGAMALQREVFDSQTLAVLDPGVVLPPFPTFFDHGGGFNAGSPAALNISDLKGSYGAGVKAALIFPGEASLFEITGYYVPRSTSTAQVDNPYRLNLAFANFPPPVGFEGDNGLWLQADRVKLRLENEIGNFEMNTHFGSNTMFNLLLGIRYFCLKENFSIFTDDDGLVLGTPDPTNQAYYRVRTQSQIVGPHLGLQMRICLDDPDVFIGLGMNAVPGVNCSDVQIGLDRGDGLQGPSGRRSKTVFSQLLEFNVSLEFGLTERICLRAGYQAILLLNVPVSYEQVNFDPSNTMGTPRENGMALFHGPSLMLQF